MVRPLPLLAAFVLAAALLALLLLGPAAGASEAAQCKLASKPAYELSGSKAAKVTLCLLNKQRRSRGMHALHGDRNQAKAASKHNRAMLRTNCFDHLCPGERDLVGRIASAGYLPCSCTWGVGENIAWGSGGLASPKSIVKGWMDSPPHRANILNRHFDEIGVAITRGAPGQGRQAATYTTDFGFKR